MLFELCNKGALAVAFCHGGNLLAMSGCVEMCASVDHQCFALGRAARAPAGYCMMLQVSMLLLLFTSLLTSLVTVYAVFVMQSAGCCC